MTDSSTEGIKTVLHPVSDLDRAKPVYTALLGGPPQTDTPYYVGFDVAGQHIGLVPGGGSQEMSAPVAYWHVADIEAKLAEVIAAGAAVKESPHDVGGGRLVATFTDPDGSVLGLLQDTEGRLWISRPRLSLGRETAGGMMPNGGSRATSISG